MTTPDAQARARGFESYSYRTNLHAYSMRGTDSPTPLRLWVHSSITDAQLFHDKVAAFSVKKLPEPKAAKSDDLFVMNLTVPTPDKDKALVWGFDLFRKCNGYRITAPNGKFFDVVGPTQTLGFGGTKDFQAFYKWAVKETDIESQINAKLGMERHVPTAERSRTAVGEQIIGTCAICEHEQVVHDVTMVKHGYQRPGVGYLIGECFGVSRPAYEVSPQACKDYLPVLRGALANYTNYLSRLKAKKIESFTRDKKDFRSGNVAKIVVKKGEREYDSILQSEISQTERQIGFVAEDITRITKKIENWKPGKLRKASPIVVSP
jgi:hypothetical protein